MTATVGAPGRRDTRVLGLVGAGHFLSHFYILSLPPLFILLKAEFDVSWTAIGLLATLFMAANGISQVPMGFLVDRVGAPRVLIGGLTVEAIAIAMIGAVPSFPPMLVLAFIAGLGHSVFHPANYAILSASISEQRMGRAFSIHTFCGFLGTAVAPVTMIALAGAFGWRLALVLAGAMGIALAIVILAQARHLADGTRLGTGREDGGQRGAPAGRVLGLLLSVPMVMLFFFFVFTSVLISGMQTFSIVGLAALHGTALEVSTRALSGFLTALAGGVLVGGAIADRTSRHDLVAVVAFAISAVVVLAAGATPMPEAALLALFVVAGFCQGVVIPSRDMMVRALAPSGSSGKAFGFMAAGGSAGGVLTPVLFGWAVDGGAPEWIFRVMALVMVLAILTVWRRRPG